MNIDLTKSSPGIILLDPTIIPGDLIVGTGEAGRDYTITFDGESSDGILTWNEGESRFEFNSDVKCLRKLGVGDDPVSTSIITSKDSFVTSGGVNGIFSQLTYTPNLDISNSATGVFSQVLIAGSNWAAGSKAIGGYFATFWTSPAGSSNIDLIGISAVGGLSVSTGACRDVYGISITAYDAFVGLGTLSGTNAYGVCVRDSHANLSVSNQYGIYIEAPTQGSVLNEALHVHGGRSYFGGHMFIEAGKNLNFRDDQIGITSGADGLLNLFADGGITLGDVLGGNYTVIEPDGSPVFVGTAGLAYGSLYLHEGTQNIDISTPGQGTYVKVTGFTTGLLNNVTINSDAFNVSNVGVYKVDWQISGDSDGANKTYECDIFVNGVEQSDGSSRRKFGAAGDQGSMSGTAILDITDTGHDIDIRIKEPGAAAGTDIVLLHINFNIVQIGGT